MYSRGEKNQRLELFHQLIVAKETYRKSLIRELHILYGHSKKESLRGRFHVEMRNNFKTFNINIHIWILCIDSTYNLIPRSQICSHLANKFRVGLGRFNIGVKQG